MKPDWLIKQESKKFLASDGPVTCETCDHFGKPVKMTKHKGEKWCEVHECAIHPGCYNTRFSLSCSDWVNTSS